MTQMPSWVCVGHDGLLLPRLMMISTQRKFKLWKLQLHCQVDWKTKNRSFSSCQVIANLCCEFSSLWKMLKECSPFHGVFCIDLRLSSGYCIKYHQLDGLNNRRLFLGDPRSKCQQIRCLTKTTFLVCRWLPSCYILMWWKERERERERERELWSLPCFLRTLIAPGSSPSWLHLSLMNFQRPHLQTPSHWGLGHQRMNLGGTQTCSK